MIIQADILKWAATYTGPKFHALLSDPPYELGFMNRKWDSSGIAFRPETWAAIGQHLHPGAFGMAFAGSRTYHRIACAIEDAGFIIHPVIMSWAFGQGFPKATRIKYAICKCEPATKHDMPRMPDADVSPPAKAESRRRAILQPGMPKQGASAKRAMSTKGRAWRSEWLMEGRRNVQAKQRQLHRPKVRAMPRSILGDGSIGWLHHGAPSSNGADVRPDAGARRSGASPRPRHAKQQPVESGAMAGQSKPQGGRARQYCDRCGLPTEDIFSGHRYGRQALKPALEPLIVFQKPYAGSPLSNITSTGAGALWIDGSRIGTDDDNSRRPVEVAGVAPFGAGSLMGGTGHPNGRWPANLVLSHSPACNGTCAPGCPVAALGAQSGESSSKGHFPQQRADSAIFGDAYGDNVPESNTDTGTAARFFYQADYMAERLELADAIAYVAKASRAEREAGLDPRQTAIMRLLDDEDGDDFDATTVDDGRETPIDNPFQRGETTRRNTHPTIKPISLTRYLATLLLPPPEYGPRRLLIPFSGAGSEVIGADLAGWEDVTGIELEAEHVAIANARRAYWQQRRWELGDPARKLSVKAAPAVPAGQVDMFESEAA